MNVVRKTAGVTNVGKGAYWDAVTRSYKDGPPPGSIGPGIGVVLDLPPPAEPAWRKEGVPTPRGAKVLRWSIPKERVDECRTRR